MTAASAPARALEALAPTLAAPGASPAVAADPSAPSGSPCPAGTQAVTVGYEPGIPFSGGEVETRVLRVLKRAFPSPCYELSFDSYAREDLADSVVKGQLDIGVLGVASATSYAERGVASLPAVHAPGVDVLMLHPASYSVVSAKPEAAPTSGAPVSDMGLLVPIGALAGLSALVVCAYLLNFRLPRPRRRVSAPSTRIDPRLVRLSGSLHWLYASTSGRVLGLIWALLGTILVLEAASSEDVVQAALRSEWRPLRGAHLASYPGRDIYELRDGDWRKCARPFKCLQNYRQGDTLALAGDRDVLCRHAAETGAATLEFLPDIAVPLMYALLLRPKAEAAPGAPLERLLLGALQTELYVGSPFRACDPPEGQAVGSR